MIDNLRIAWLSIESQSLPVICCMANCVYEYQFQLCYILIILINESITKVIEINSDLKIIGHLSLQK